MILIYEESMYFEIFACAKKTVGGFRRRLEGLNDNRLQEAGGSFEVHRRRLEGGGSDN